MGKAVKKATGLGLIGSVLGFGKDKSAERAAKRQEALIEKQRKTEQLRLDEGTSEVALRKAGGISRRAGRRSLIATSQSGLATSLGGTANG